MGLSQTGGTGLGSRLLGCLGNTRSVSKSPNYIKVYLRFGGGGETAGEKDMSVVPFAIPTVWSHPPSQRGPVIL